MALFKVVDTLLAKSTIARWILVVLTIIMIAGSTYLRIANISLENRALKAESSLVVQNQKIKELGDESKRQQTIFQESMAKANKIALESQRSLQAIEKYTFTGNCESMIDQAINLIKEKEVQ